MLSNAQYPLVSCVRVYARAKERASLSDRLQINNIMIITEPHPEQPRERDLGLQVRVTCKCEQICNTTDGQQYRVSYNNNDLAMQ